MNKILIALDNENIFNDIKSKLIKEEIYEQDITRNELVVEMIAKNKFDIVVTKDNLKGEMTKEIYIKQLKLASPDIKIILYTEELNDNYKSFLFANEVFNIIEGDVFNIEILMENIEDDKKKIYIKEQNSNKLKQKVKLIEKSNVILKQSISIYGTSGAGKSYVASLIAKKIEEKLKVKMLLWDMDVENSNVDIYNDIKRPQNILKDMVDEIDKGTFNHEFFNQAVYRSSNIDYLTNNATIYDYQEKLSSKYYEIIKNEIDKVYDIMVVDLPAMPLLDSISFFLKNSTQIFFVVNPNYISIRQGIKYLQIISNIYDIPKKQINIIINKVTESSLSTNQVKALLEEYNVILEIKYSFEIEKNINGIRDFYIDERTDFSKLYKTFGINDTKNIKKYDFLNIMKYRNKSIQAVGEDDASKYI